jgi:hypothetical protein
MVSWLANVSTVDTGTALLYIGGLTLPVLTGAAVLQLPLRTAFAGRYVVMLLGFLALQVPFLAEQAGRYAADLSRTYESDALSGTYGFNADQLSFMLGTMACLLAAAILVPGPRWRRIAAGVVLVPVVLVCFLASNKVLYVVLPVAMLMTFVALVPRRAPLLLAGAIVIGIVGAVLATNLLGQWRVEYYVSRATDLEWLADEGKARALLQVPEVLTSSPLVPLVGVGPGAYSSRAARALIPDLQDELGLLLEPDGEVTTPTLGLVGVYRPPAMLRWVAPLMPYESYGAFGSLKTSGPFTSWASIPVETGVPSALLLLAMYGTAAAACIVAFRRGLAAHDVSRAGLAAAGLGGVLLLGLLSVFDNYLEITRLTVPLWMTIAVALQRGSPISDGARHGP